jgi:integrase
VRAVRAFYLDLHTWAVEEPERWAAWAVPSPVTDRDTRGFPARRRRVKERMDDRTRRLQPLLPALVDRVEAEHGRLQTVLDAAGPLPGGRRFTVAGRTFERVWTTNDASRRLRGGQANVRVRDVSTGDLLNVTRTEDSVFWEWAAIEVLRQTGIRIEELVELTHLSIRQYQRPNGEVVALLVIAPSKTDRERVIPVSAELFAVLAAIIRRYTRHGQPVPLVRRYDTHQRQMSPPMPFLFQRLLGATPQVIAGATVLNQLRRRCAALAEEHPGFRGLSFTPHDFRRLFATDVVNNGLPIQIGAALLGHLNVQTTRGSARGRVRRGRRPPLPDVPGRAPAHPAGGGVRRGQRRRVERVRATFRQT